MRKKKLHRNETERRFDKRSFIVLLIGFNLGVSVVLLAQGCGKVIAAMQQETVPQIVIDHREEDQTEVAEDDLEGIRTQAEEENEKASKQLMEQLEGEGVNENIPGAVSGEPLDILKAYLENGESTSAALRKALSDEIVVASGGRYYFLPIEEELKKNSYKSENLVIDDNGVLSYQEDGETISKKGIDVSRYQGEIDWERVRADGVEFAFIRAGIRGYGTGKLVPEEGFAENLVEAVDAGVDVGVYFFSQAVTEEEAVEEADLVIDSLSGNGIPYPVVYDLEKVKSADGRMNKMTKEEMTKVCIAFCERIREAGYTPMIYGNLETFCLMLDMKQLEEYPKWFAFYQSEFYFPYDYQIWQYSDKGRVDGIEGDVDMNILIDKTGW